MKINDLLESRVNEGPIGTALGAAGGAMLGGPVGAAAGGVAGNYIGNKLSGVGQKLKGAWNSAKQGYQAGKAAASGGVAGKPNFAAAKPPLTPEQLAQVQKGVDINSLNPPLTPEQIQQVQPAQATPSSNVQGGNSQAGGAAAGGNVAGGAAAGGNVAGGAAAGGNGKGAVMQQVDQTVAAIKQVRSRDRQSVVQAAQQKIGALAQAKPEEAPAEKPDAGAGAMNQVANNLSNNGQSSTGGQTQSTPTGLTHVASANNQNQQQNTQGSTTNIDANAAANKQAQGQNDQTAAINQMKATQDANANAEQIRAAAAAASAKPGFQQTAADKLAIKAAADLAPEQTAAPAPDNTIQFPGGQTDNTQLKTGTGESIRFKKPIVEFYSKFLGQHI